MEEQKHELTEYGHKVTAAEKQYRHRSLRELLIGPFLSVLIHIGLIGTLALLMVGKTHKPPSVEIEVSMAPLPHVELEPDPVAEEDEPEPEQEETLPEAELEVPDDAEGDDELDDGGAGFEVDDDILAAFDAAVEAARREADIVAPDGDAAALEGGVPPRTGDDLRS